MIDGVRVSLGVGVIDGVEVWVGVELLVGDEVGVNEAVAVGLAVAVAVGVLVDVGLGPEVGVRVALESELASAFASPSACSDRRRLGPVEREGSGRHAELGHAVALDDEGAGLAVGGGDAEDAQLRTSVGTKVKWKIWSGSTSLQLANETCAPVVDGLPVTVASGWGVRDGTTSRCSANVFAILKSAAVRLGRTFDQDEDVERIERRWC